MKQVADGVPIVEGGTGSGWPQVKGNCPACGSASLFLGSGGYVTCAIIKCPNPTAVADLLLDSPVSSVEEIDALPRGTILLTAGENPAIKSRHDGLWWLPEKERPMPPTLMRGFRVLHKPAS